MKARKHLALKLNEKLNFREHLTDRFAIVYKGIGMLKNMNIYRPRYSLVTL